MSMIFLNNQKEANPKLVRFVILLSRLQCQEALKMLSDFNRESYYDNLHKLLQMIGDEAALRLDLFKMRQMNMHLKTQITHLNHRLAQESLRQRPDNMTQYQKQIIQLFTYLERNELTAGQKRADIFKIDHLSVAFQELKQYRLLKDHIRHNNMKEDLLRFQSTQGEQLRMLVVDNTSKYNETIAFLKQQFPKIIGDLQLSEVPVNIFDEGFKKIYQKFIEQLRKMKNSYQDLNRPIKQKILVFSKRQGIQIDQLAESTKCLQELLLKLDKILQRPQPQRNSFRRSISRLSIQSVNSNASFISNDSNSQSKKFKRNKNMFGNQYQSQVNKIHKIISKYVQAIPKYTKLGLLDKLKQLVKKVDQVTQQFQQQKSNHDECINSFMVADKNFRQNRKDCNNLSKQEILPVLKNKQSNDHNIVQNNETVRIKKQLQEERSKRIKVEQSNTRLLIKVKEYSSKDNQSFIQQTINNAQRQCEASSVSLQQEIANLNGIINQLKQQLEQKATKITSLEISRKEDRTKIERQRQNLLDSQKVKYNRLRDDYDAVMDELNNLGRLYDETFLISQQTPHNDQLLKLKDEIQLLRAENEEMRQQMMRKQKKQVGIGVSRRIFNSQTHQSNNNNEQSASKLSLESKAVKQIKELQDQMATLQLQNKQLASQINKIEYYKTLLEKQTRECSQLKQQISILIQQNQKLTKDLRMVEIHKVTHNEKNLPYLHLFPPGFIFEDHDYQERLFLLEHLQSYTGPIRKTRLIYRADPHNRTNFHKYVDKQRHVVAIFKTIYGRLIAGYSQEAFDAAGIIRGHGIIFSLWGRKVFELKQKRAISYDDYFLIFGNSELRIKSGEFHLFSNFGIASSYYNNRGEKVNALLGEDNEREVDLSNFQVYALDLEY